LRARAEDWAKRKGLKLVIPPLRYCTDNAAMIGYVGVLRLNRGEISNLDLGPSPHSLPQDFNFKTAAKR
jgi:N6-L-threonylcarbamoyladenine synthase